MAELMVLTVIFVAVAIAIIIADRLPIPQEVLYILVGIIIGRALLDFDLTLLAEAGAVFLIFLTAMHLQTDAIQDVLGEAVWVSIAQIGLLITVAVLSVLSGFNLYESVLIGLACGLSSSMLGVDLIGNQVDRRLLHGRLTEGINFTQDLVAVLLIGILPFWPGTLTIIGATLTVTGVLVLMLLGRNPIRHVLHWLDRDEEATLLLGISLLWTAAAVASTHPYGTVIAAVAAGVLLSGHPENLTLLETMRPVKDFFAALFFVVLGVLVTPSILTELYLTVALFIIVTVVRPLLTIGILWVRGVNPHSAFTTAMQLDQVSEIVLLLGLLFQVQGIVDPAVTQAIIMAGAGSFIYSSYTTKHSDLLYHRFLLRFTETPRSIVEHTDYVVIAGYGRWGRAAAETVSTPVIIDNDPEKVRHARRDGYNAVMGDIRDRETWKRVGVQDASAVVLTIPSDTVAYQLLSTVEPDKIIAITETSGAAAHLSSHDVRFAIDDAALFITELQTVLDDYLQHRFPDPEQ